MPHAGDFPRHPQSDALKAAVRKLAGRGLSAQAIGDMLGVSKSYAQRLQVAERVPVDPVRVSAGLMPLPAGHPLSWCAISERPFEDGA